MSAFYEEALSDPVEVEEIRGKLIRIGWHRYRIRPSDVEDVVQTAFATYLEVRHRYAKTDDHRAIFLGIFRKKCLEHIERSVRAVRRLRRYCANTDAARENPWIRPSAPAQSQSTLDGLVQQETRQAVRRVLGDLNGQVATIVAVGEGKITRQQLIAAGVNKNTVDSQLHAQRGVLRRALAKKEIRI